MKELLEDKKFRGLFIGLLIVIPLEIMSILSIHFFLWIRILIFSAVFLIWGRDIFFDGLKNLVKLKFSSINLLVSIVIFGAVYLREFEEACVIIILFSIGEALEEFGVNKSRASIEKLVSDFPRLVFIKGSEEKVCIGDVKSGDVIIVKPGEQIPLDGKIIAGSSMVDESPITGEPLVKEREKGDSVYAGCFNVNGYLEIEVLRVFDETVLSQIAKLTARASLKKSSYHLFIERFSKYYTPIVIFSAFLVFFIPVFLMGKPFHKWFEQALTLLIISCPCALVMATPVAVYSAVGNASRRGALIKGGRFIEDLGRVRVVAFDKTRTITEGEPQITDIITFGNVDEKDLVACAAGLEVFSEHPLAKSIIESAKAKNIKPHDYKDFESKAGKGLKGNCNICFDAHHCMGSLDFVTEEHPISAEIIEKIHLMEKEGKTIIVVSDNKMVKGLIGISDTIRKESPSAVKKIKDLGVKTALLSGDNPSTTAFIAKKAGINGESLVLGGLLPADKMTEVAKLINEFRYVAFVGDGINDAPSIATSTVGIAMGSIGSDIAVENSDIALFNNNLNIIPYLLKLGRSTLGIIKFNIFFAVLIKIIFFMLAFMGISNIVMAIFADVGVTVLVIINSLRLIGFKE